MRYILALSLSITLFTSCKQDDELNLIFSPGRVMVVHAAPNSPSLTIDFDDKKSFGNTIVYLSNTGYLDLDVGAHNLKLYSANQAAGEAILNTDLELNENEYSTVFAIKDGINLETLVLQDDLSSPVSGRAHVRLVHLSPDAPAYDFRFKSNNVLYTSINFKQFTFFTPLTAVTDTLQVVKSSTGEEVLTQPITFTNQGIYTIYIRGYANPPINSQDTLGISFIQYN